MLKDKLGLDTRDAIIFNTLCRKPDTSQAELAKLCKVSQPSVNVRIQKLKNRGVLFTTTGIEFNKTDMQLVRVDCAAPDPERLLKNLSDCSFFVNGFVVSGARNLSLLIVGPTLTKVESIINERLRSHPGVSDITTSVVVSTSKPFVCQLDLSSEMHESCRNAADCKNCPLHATH